MTPDPHPSPAARLLAEVRACRHCAGELPQPPRPVLQFHPHACILVVGQAPGRRAHDAGIPFDDPSGDRLRAWMGTPHETFYDPHRVALLPMGFCYPGTGASGDLPPRPECAARWRARLLEQMHRVKLTLVMGQYAMAWHLPGVRGSLTDAVRAWRDDPLTPVIPLPHPSPRNNRWLQRNPWFEAEVVPQLRQRVQQALSRPS